MKQVRAASTFELAVPCPVLAYSDFGPLISLAGHLLCKRPN
jgi:hypothetical protein